MKRNRKTSTLLLIVAAAWSTSSTYGDSASGSRPAITLRILNEAGVDRRTLARAGKEAAGILGRSGVELVSVACEAGRADALIDSPCQRERGPAEFWFRIVARKPSATSDEMLGFAELDESLGSGSAGVFYPAAIQLAQKYGADVFQILGAAIAHEVGHLVLGASAHTPRGIMAPHWGRGHFELISIGELRFTPDQSNCLQSKIRTGTCASRRPSVVEHL